MYSTLLFHANRQKSDCEDNVYCSQCIYMIDNNDFKSCVADVLQAYSTVVSAAEGKDPDSADYGKVDELKQYPLTTGLVPSPRHKTFEKVNGQKSPRFL